MIMSTALVMISNALVRSISSGIHPFEIAFFRVLFGLLPLLVWGVRDRVPPPNWQILKLYASRAVLSTVTILLYFLALSLTPLAEATAIAFTAPLFTSITAAWILKEKAGIHHWVALGIGFVGTLIILRPGSEALHGGALAMLASSALVAWVLVLIKILSRTESSLAITLYTFVIQLPLLALAMIPFWQWPTMEQWPWLVAMALMGTAGQLCTTQAYKDAAVNTLLPFDFFKLIWASLIGFVFFAEVPDLFTWLGGSTIFAAAVYIAYRETQGRDPDEDPDPAPRTLIPPIQFIRSSIRRLRS